MGLKLDTAYNSQNEYPQHSQISVKIENIPLQPQPWMRSLLMTQLIVRVHPHQAGLLMTMRVQPQFLQIKQTKLLCYGPLSTCSTLQVKCARPHWWSIWRYLWNPQATQASPANLNSWANPGTRVPFLTQNFLIMISFVIKHYHKIQRPFNLQYCEHPTWLKWRTIGQLGWMQPLVEIIFPQNRANSVGVGASIHLALAAPLLWKNWYKLFS